jgi:hypothetical protein
VKCFYSNFKDARISRNRPARRRLLRWQLRHAKDLISSFSIRSRGGKWEIVQKSAINDFSYDKIDASVAELEEEKWLVGDLIGN